MDQKSRACAYLHHFTSPQNSISTEKRTTSQSKEINRTNKQLRFKVFGCNDILDVYRQFQTHDIQYQHSTVHYKWVCPGLKAKRMRHRAHTSALSFSEYF